MYLVIFSLVFGYFNPMLFSALRVSDEIIKSASRRPPVWPLLLSWLPCSVWHREGASLSSTAVAWAAGSALAVGGGEGGEIIFA